MYYECVGGPIDGDVRSYPKGEAPLQFTVDPGPVAIPDVPAPRRPVHVYALAVLWGAIVTTGGRGSYAYIGMRTGARAS